MVDYRFPNDTMRDFKAAAEKIAKIAPPKYCLVETNAYVGITDHVFVCFWQDGVQHIVGTTNGWLGIAEEKKPAVSRETLMAGFGETEIISIDGTDLSEKQVAAKRACIIAFTQMPNIKPKGLRDMIVNENVVVRSKFEEMYDAAQESLAEAGVKTRVIRSGDRNKK